MAISFGSAWSRLPILLRNALTQQGATQPHQFSFLFKDPTDDLKLRDAVKELLGKALVCEHDVGVAVDALKDVITASYAPTACQRHVFANMSGTISTTHYAPKPVVKSSFHKFTSTRARRTARAKGPEARAAVEQGERLRWIKKLVKFVVEADLPTVALAREAKDPEVRLRRMAGNRRSGTIRARVRTWSNVRRWLLTVNGRPWPSSAPEVLDYLDARMSEPCGKSVPKAVAASLGFVERAGGVAEEDRISLNVSFLNAINDMSLEAIGTGAAKKKAPRPTMQIMTALELVIMNGDAPRYWRAYAWFKLVKIWGSLGWDDSKGWLPMTTFLSSDGLTATIGRTKTTGADKKVNALPLFISSACSFSGQPWLQEGFEIWSSAAFWSERDFWLSLPNACMDGSTGQMAEYSDSIALGRNLFQGLCQPKCDETGCLVSGNQPIFAPGAASFFTEHGDRVWLISVAAELSIEKSRREFCGKWNPEGSNEYVHTARAIIKGVQEEVMERIRNKHPVDKADMFQDYKAYLLKKNLAQSHEQADQYTSAFQTPMQVWQAVQCGRYEVSMAPHHIAQEEPVHAATTPPLTDAPVEQCA